MHLQFEAERGSLVPPFIYRCIRSSILLKFSLNKNCLETGSVSFSHTSRKSIICSYMSKQIKVWKIFIIISFLLKIIIIIIYSEVFSETYSESQCFTPSADFIGIRCHSYFTQVAKELLPASSLWDSCHSSKPWQNWNPGRCLWTSSMN